MQYRSDKYGNPLSILGFGCMRFERKLGAIEYAKAEALILRAVEAGVNYFDTAYIYPGSEALLGEVLEKNGLRDRVKIATKLPHYLIRSREGLDKLFDEELRRLKTDHVDYYLMHMLSDVKTWERLKALGIEEWIAQKKASGAIHQVGFSYHGGSEMFCRIVDAYDWDFTMIQYNYMDKHTQAGVRGLRHAHAKGLPVMIMEPLRGGKLVSNIPEEGRKIFDRHAVRRTPAQWAFRWLYNQSEVTCVLSGMNTMEMLEDNLATASQAQIGELTPEDQAMLKSVVQAINAKMRVGCTGCGYCMPCPKGVDIPGCFAALNCAAS
ncbi:MAG: aldo/keto reductase, partial [Clostridia bacterium]|nr:aldo/keto reductase [Clostridia bacterium]